MIPLRRFTFALFFFPVACLYVAALVLTIPIGFICWVFTGKYWVYEKALGPAVDLFLRIYPEKKEVS